MIPFAPPTLAAPPNVGGATSEAATLDTTDGTFAESLSLGGSDKVDGDAPSDGSDTPSLPDGETPPDEDTESRDGVLLPEQSEVESIDLPLFADLGLLTPPTRKGAIASPMTTSGQSANTAPLAKAPPSASSPTALGPRTPDNAVDNAPLPKSQNAVATPRIVGSAQQTPANAKSSAPVALPPASPATAATIPPPSPAATASAVQIAASEMPPAKEPYKSGVKTVTPPSSPTARLVAEALKQQPLETDPRIPRSIGQSVLTTPIQAYVATSTSPQFSPTSRPAPSPVADIVQALASEVAEPLLRSEQPSLVPDRIASTQALPHNMAPADQTRQITQQLATVLPTTVPGMTEILLQPEELGRVRMTLTLQDGAMTLIIQADRADTTDLLRRNLDQLVQTYRQMGFETLNFSFAGSAGEDATAAEDATTAAGATTEDSDELLNAPPPHIHAPHATTARLDLRM